MDTENDDDTTGTNAGDGRLSRRRMLGNVGILGAAIAGSGSLGVGRALAASTGSSAATTAAEAAAALALTPEAEEGPFYVSIEKIRKNVRMGRPGIPLKLRVKVIDSSSGSPIQNAALDIWHCDASGLYSDESSAGTVGSTFLRGVQFTGANGIAEFDSIYPGHYQGRDTHIHLKVHIGGATSGSKLTGGHVSHTGQLFFSDAISKAVYAVAPYASDTEAWTTHADDHVYTEQGGAKTQLVLKRLGTTVRQGYLGTITLSIDPSATPAAVGVSGGGGGG